MLLLQKWAAIARARLIALALALRARLIDDVHRAWRYASVWIAGLGAALIEIWNQLPAELRAQLPAPVAQTVPSLILISVVVARLVKQRG